MFFQNGMSTSKDSAPSDEFVSVSFWPYVCTKAIINVNIITCRVDNETIFDTVLQYQEQPHYRPV